MLLWVCCLGRAGGAAHQLNAHPSPLHSHTPWEAGHLLPSPHHTPASGVGMPPGKAGPTPMSRRPSSRGAQKARVGIWGGSRGWSWNKPFRPLWQAQMSGSQPRQAPCLWLTGQGLGSLEVGQGSAGRGCEAALHESPTTALWLWRGDPPPSFAGQGGAAGPSSTPQPLRLLPNPCQPALQACPPPCAAQKTPAPQSELGPRPPYPHSHAAGVGESVLLRHLHHIHRTNPP